jgi:hypothetical protein
MQLKLLLEQLGSEPKEHHEILRPAMLRGDLLHRRPGRKQWQYGPSAHEPQARFKVLQQLYEQPTGRPQFSLGAAFWELR